MIGSNSNSSSSCRNSSLFIYMTSMFIFSLCSTTSFFVDSLSSSSSSRQVQVRPIVSLTGNGDVSAFMYGKLQRATSIYGSGLLGPTTAVVHGDKDTNELLPGKVSSGINAKQQMKDLENVLWNQFGMATCEGTVEREDLLTEMSYLKPRLTELKDTFVFLDATTTSMPGGNKKDDGVGGLFSSLFRKKEPKSPSQAQAPSPSTSTCWLDVDLIQFAITSGSNVFIVCESKDTAYCHEALKECLSSIKNDNINNSITTIVSPDDGIGLGGNNDNNDSKWNSLRPQDLEGELSQPISVRDGSLDYDIISDATTTTDTSAAAAIDGNNSNREARAAAAQSSTATAASVPTGISLPRHDLAEVCVQCALRLPTTSTSMNSHKLRIVRVTPYGNENSNNNNDNANADTEQRPNQDYFSLTGGKKAKAIAGIVTSVNWATTLSCFVAPRLSGLEGRDINSNSFAKVKDFPKRPDL